MNLPQYARAVEMAALEYAKTCEEAKERFHKALTVARQQFFEDPDENVPTKRADYADERR